MICPLMAIGQCSLPRDLIVEKYIRSGEDWYCRKENCAWYASKQCAILSIMKALQDIAKLGINIRNST